MSALPQRKKSAEEIAKLREEMGLPSAASAPAGTPAAPAPEEPLEPEPPRPKPAAKAVRSLKRSERKPAPEAAPAPAPSGASPIPARRHSERELDRMRRQEAMTAMTGEVPAAVAHLKKSMAHPALITLGYVLAFGGGVGAFPVALYIALKKPFSRHHAGLMVMIAVLVVAFGALYLFPNLNPVHAS